MDVGDRFPDFVLKDENGEEFDSRMLEGIRHIVYFYPPDAPRRRWSSQPTCPS